MSLEAAIENLTAAVRENTEALKALSGRPAAANGVLPAVEPAAAEPAAAAVEKRKPGRPPKKQAVTEDQVRTAFGGYLSAVKDPAGRTERKANVGAILAHFGVERATEIPEESRAEALGYVAKLTAGELPDFMNEDAADEADEDEDAMI